MACYGARGCWNILTKWMSTCESHNSELPEAPLSCFNNNSRGLSSEWGLEGCETSKWDKKLWLWHHKLSPDHSILFKKEHIHNEIVCIPCWNRFNNRKQDQTKKEAIDLVVTWHEWLRPRSLTSHGHCWWCKSRITWEFFTPDQHSYENIHDNTTSKHVENV